MKFSLQYLTAIISLLAICVFPSCKSSGSESRSVMLASTSDGYSYTTVSTPTNHVARVVYGALYDLYTNREPGVTATPTASGGFLVSELAGAYRFECRVAIPNSTGGTPAFNFPAGLNNSGDPGVATQCRMQWSSHVSDYDGQYFTFSGSPQNPFQIALANRLTNHPNRQAGWEGDKYVTSVKDSGNVIKCVRSGHNTSLDNRTCLIGKLGTDGAIGNSPSTGSNNSNMISGRIARVVNDGRPPLVAGPGLLSVQLHFEDTDEVLSMIVVTKDGLRHPQTYGHSWIDWTRDGEGAAIEAVKDTIDGNWYIKSAWPVVL